MTFTEDEFNRVSDYLKAVRGMKPMSKLSLEMLGIKIERAYKAEQSRDSQFVGLLNEWLEQSAELTAAVAERDRQVEALQLLVRQKREEGEKLKAQLTGVLVQFKNERERHGLKVQELEERLGQLSAKAVEQDRKRAVEEEARNKKTEGLFEKLFEKTNEISGLKQANFGLASQVEGLLADLAKTRRERDSSLCIEFGAASLPGKSEILERSEAKTERGMFVVNLMGSKKTRSAFLGFLTTEDMIALGSTCRLARRVVTSDFSFLRSIERSLWLKSKKRITAVNSTLGRTN